MTEERLKTLLFNSITFINTEFFELCVIEEKVRVLKDELGFTDDEIKELNIIEECL